MFLQCTNGGGGGGMVMIENAAEPVLRNQEKTSPLSFVGFFAPAPIQIQIEFKVLLLDYRGINERPYYITLYQRAHSLHYNTTLTPDCRSACGSESQPAVESAPCSGSVALSTFNMGLELSSLLKA